MMPVLEIIRLEENYKYGTFGVLKINKEVFCWTLEPRDEENKPFESSIPAQQYTCERYSSDKYPNTFQVTNVPGREGILFHPGNTADDTAGCILLGETVTKLKYDRRILNSGATFKYFMSALADYNKFSLTIREVY